MEGKYELNKIFASVDNKHFIEISLIDKIAWFRIINIEYESYKTFLDLLKDIVKYMLDSNITHIKQYIVSNDLENFKYSEYILSSEDIYIITTPFDKFIPEIVNALGINIA